MKSTVNQGFDIEIVPARSAVGLPEAALKKILRRCFRLKFRMERGGDRQSEPFSNTKDGVTV